MGIFEDLERKCASCGKPLGHHYPGKKPGIAYCYSPQKRRLGYTQVFVEEGSVTSELDDLFDEVMDDLCGPESKKKIKKPGRPPKKKGFVWNAFGDDIEEDNLWTA